ncbi:MAG: RagB/SusD family nutrient uptake outer membrane protein [Gemmatimonadetes bacterium]|nr:RagB/SusD family nutrient uptake outer membrane protein [Gemmatimonadota bacterium]
MNEFHGSAVRLRPLRTRLRRWAAPGALLVAGAIGVSGCELSVVNPGQIADADLENPVAIPGIVLGVIGDYLTGLASGGGGGTLVASAMLTDEMSNSGSWVGLLGLNYGQNRDDWAESNLRWAYPAQARWTANRAIERVSSLTTRNPAADPNIALLHLYGGFANRVLGDTFCDAVRDGGPREPYHVYFIEAEEHFTRAIAVAEAALAAGDSVSARGVAQERMDNLVIAAYGGRAQARMMLAGLGIAGYTWQMAVQDAERVPTEFVHSATFTNNSSNPWPSWGFSLTATEATVWGTPFREWGQDFSAPVAQRTGDARVVYESFGSSPRTGRDNRRPFMRQRKYTSSSSNLPNIRGTEMRLIEGEAALAAGNWPGAVQKINDVRDFRNEFFTAANQLPMVDAGDATEAWHLLMRERGIEMWLEGRRLPDLRRWEVSPGREMVPFQVIRRPADTPNPEEDPFVSVYAVEAMCIAVSRNEKLSNPNWR